MALAAAALLLGAAGLLGLSVAGALLGGGWIPPGTSTAGPVLHGMLTGRPGAGLAPDLAARLPEVGQTYLCVAATETVALTVLISATALAWRYHQPGDARRGMATRSEARQVLGRHRLHAARNVLRPDLHPGLQPDLNADPHRRQPSQGGAAARRRAPSTARPTAPLRRIW